jgi:cytosine/adenosine deaminase-related metal-dependent hydrolase
MIDDACHSLVTLTFAGLRLFRAQAKTGSLEVGKAADFMAVSFDSIETQPM